MTRILIIEDNSSDRLLMRMAIENEGIQAVIHELEDGEQAILFMSQSWSAPDLILLDLNLPRYSGHQILKQIRASALVGVPVLVISSSDASREQPALREHTPHFFRKPHTFDEFMQLGPIISSILASKRGAQTAH